MFEYGVLHMSLRPELQPHGFVFEWQYGLDGELVDVPWYVDRGAPAAGPGRLHQLAHPGLAAMYLGRRGWEAFQVSWVGGGPGGPAVEYHFRRSSDDRPPVAR